MRGPLTTCPKLRKRETMASEAAQGFEVVTLFPALVEAFATQGLIQKGIDRGLIEVHATDPRDFVEGGYKSVDDTPFGGGAGMVVQAEPIARAIESIESQRGPSVRVLVTPSAPRFDQRAAELLAGASRITLLCGRYEGIDDRIRETMVDHCYSLGDFVLNGGEVAALAIIEAVARLRPGVLGNDESVRTESFASRDGGMRLEHPHYTKPATWRGHAVPRELQSGDHARIDRWRSHAAVARTHQLRPDLRVSAPRTRPKPEVHWAVLGHRALDAEARSQLAEAHERLASVGVALHWVGPGKAPTGVNRSRALRDLRRDLRRRRGAAPTVLRLWPAARPAPLDALDAHSLLSAGVRELSRENDPSAWLLVSRWGTADGEGFKDPVIDGTWWPELDLRGDLAGVDQGVGAAELGDARAKAAAREKDRREATNLLANPDALIDISQPAGPGAGPLAETVDAVIRAVRRAFGPAPTGPNHDFGEDS